MKEPRAEEITYENMTQILIDVAPDLSPRYHEELRRWGDEDPGPHNIYGDVLDPYLLDLLKTDEENRQLLHRIFRFLEMLANHKDRRVREVLVVTVLEYLLHSLPHLEVAREKYMGETTLTLSREIQAFWRTRG